MLKKFSVKYFKNFKDKIKLDFSDVRDYKFNDKCIKNKLLNKIIIYGKNAVGKSNFGLALFDITTHLGDKNVTPGMYDYYLNNEIDEGYAEFEYEFKFDQSEIRYIYRKDKDRQLLYEKVSINEEIILEYDYDKSKGNMDKIRELLPYLNFEFRDEKISMIRYIVSNAVEASIDDLKLMVRFVNNMLWIRSLDENRYIGYKKDIIDYFNFIFESDNLIKFQELLSKAGIEDELIALNDPDGNMRLYFKSDRPLPFFKVASNGTKALYALFYWLTTAKEVSFLFVDEFDAYYHFELAEMIVQLLEEREDFQSILTSHNTNLMTNKIMRPDCYFILTPNKLTALNNATDRELREGHNLEKLYINGEFDQ